MTAPPAVPADAVANPELTIAMVGVIIAALTLGIAVLGLYAKWLRDGKASLTIHYEFHPESRSEDGRIVFRNTGHGDAYNVRVQAFRGERDVRAQLLGPMSFEQIAAGHSVHTSLHTDFDYPEPDRALVTYSHGRFAADPIALQNRPAWLRWIQFNSQSTLDVPLTAHHVA